MKLKLPKAYVLENVWTDKSDDLKQEIIEFWIANGALTSREKAAERLTQVISIARTKKDRKLVAVSTVYAQHNQQLGHDFYYFRCFVEENHRRARLALFLIRAVYKNLNARFTKGETPNVIGLLMVVQNESLKEHHRPAVWTRTGMVYVGSTANGDHIRVNYFNGARIT